MQTYKEFAPTQFDIKGLSLKDKQNWLVAPVGQNRDSEIFELSNFRVAKRQFEEIDADEESHEVHRFGHWACGWFEIILINPDSQCAEIAERMEAALADYPVLDDEDFSELEYEMEYEEE